MNTAFSNRVSAVAQQVIRHPADYEITDGDKSFVSQGKALWILGSALAKIKLICRTFRSMELMVFLLAKKNNPYQIVDILIPKEQFANSSAVLTTGQVVLKANREARAMDCIIVGAAHSHALMSVFSSSTDLEYMRQLNEEEVGWSAQIPVISTGRLLDRPNAGAASSSAGQIFEAVFEDHPRVSVKIETNRADFSPEDLKVSMKCREPLQVSSFQTFNADGDYFMPAYKILRCPWCHGVKHEEAVTDVAIHIIGEEVLGHRERQEFLAQAEQRMPRHGVPYYQYNNPQYGYNSWRTNEPGWSPKLQYNSPGEHACSAKPAEFVIWRHGQSRSISAEIMEEAAYRCGALAKAMGWRQPDKTALNAEDEDEGQVANVMDPPETEKPETEKEDGNVNG
ncbi:MAG: hypothetical protein ABSG67_04075 [Thermoguttaceae bacterium]|jgi:hypothetical protein